ncbi:outer membrane lipoprotein carrier protein LolA [Maribellus mangrovi]|uniref:outer membrane lipoprotein carrier protein LolA n=1 Tax=Maribellus mangrovi TaxID=3133146 RepID=UPI0030EEA487
MIQRISIVIVLIFYVIATYGQETKFEQVVQDYEAVIQKLDSVAKITRTIRSDFVQTKHLTVLEEDIVSKGKFIFSKPSNIKWSYLEPYIYQISFIDSKLTINNDGKVTEHDANSNEIFSEINNIISGMINGSIMSSPMFNVTMLQNNKQYLVELEPKNNEFKRFINRIKLYLGKDDFMVSQIVMEESADDYTEITFQNRKINTPVSDSDIIIN